MPFGCIVDMCTTPVHGRKRVYMHVDTEQGTSLALVGTITILSHFLLPLPLLITLSDEECVEYVDEGQASDGRG